MESRKVSIIIPIYKTEKYLPECVASVLNQTYGNLQIILVDDGSPDRCGDICDQYAETDRRIQVVHKENGGLSDARNAGLPLADGDFVFYLDADDYLEADAIALLMEEQAKTSADIVTANFFYTYPDHEDAACHYRSEAVLSNYDAMKALVSGEIETFAWGKLLRAELAKKYPFPRGKQFEDHYWTHHVFGDAEKTAVLSQILVHYRQRSDSISFTYDLDRLDILGGWMDRKEYLQRHYPDLVEICMQQYAQRYVGIAWLVLTRMKTHRKEAFKRLRHFNFTMQLQLHVEGSTKVLISALDHGALQYSLSALWYRIKGVLQ